jgi:E3 ubiquitin-protein ligase HERC2
VAKKIRELMADSENMDVLHESHDIFKREQDEQLVQWMNRLLHQKQEVMFYVK